MGRPAGEGAGQGRAVSRTLARPAAVAGQRVTGLSREVLADLVAELGPRWQPRQDAVARRAYTTTLSS